MQSDAHASSEDCQEGSGHTSEISKPSSSSPKKKVDNDHREDQAKAATAVVSNSGAHVVAATAEENQ